MSEAYRELRVELGDRGYPILVGKGLLGNCDLSPYVSGSTVMIVTNDIVAPLYLEMVRNSFPGCRLNEVILPDGEAFKNWETLNRIFDALLEQRHSRKTTLVALGGGVVGDMAGFAAACYQRGVDFIQIPTTLLAQVDSSVGGKTGINHPLGKNMIGAFHQPRCVLIDTDTLQTLPRREISAGLAEVIKYGLIREPDFLAWLEDSMSRLTGLDADALTEAIYRSCACKAEVVAQDEREGGLRAILNLGHTFGHAIETHAGYGNWLHGEAVGAGMMMAADLSNRLGLITDEDRRRVESILTSAGLPTSVPAGMTPDHFMNLMAVDKKNVDGQLRLILLRGLGEAEVTDRFSPDALADTLATFCH
ncbi:3-dehydroquinate synthase [Marinobacter zhanjiangensis]|uniref:3-dehydroquinate synthase n=1 Tax=Marinobacter zhanjiangensis TaxID=578215 RepID=A0ABQ3B8U6_9GAMM|nr:3-dehydroquinate synthase [Marinobacter zhanjiangensis]GGY79316.1 3-dehydroquinate synthase [Marinobacter zhanjiangensis]